MEKLNLNFNGSDNVINSICWICSVLSWLLLIITGWISLRWLEEYDLIWTIIKVENPKIGGKHIIGYFPFQMQVSLIYLVFILTMVIALAGFIIYMFKSICKKDNNVFNGMIGNWSRFHFFPLLCASTLFIIGECYDDYFLSNRHNEDMAIAGFIFTIFGLGSLIFIYIMTDLNTDWYIVLLLKKGTYSCLITLMWYYFCYNIYYIRSFDTYKDNDDWRKGCGISFSIIFGIGSLIFAYIFKDLVVAGMTALIYIGLAAFYFNLDNDNIRKKKSANKNADGSIDIVMIFLSVVLIVFLVIKNKEDCLKS